MKLLQASGLILGTLCSINANIWNLIDQNKNIKVNGMDSGKCLTAVDGLGGLLKIADCEMGSSFQEFLFFGFNQIKTLHVNCCLAAREEDRYGSPTSPVGWYVRVEECVPKQGEKAQWFSLDETTGRVSSYASTTDLCWKADGDHVVLVDCDTEIGSEALRFGSQVLEPDTVNQCESNSCGNGICEDKYLDYRCHCHEGWHGRQCDQRTQCDSNPCDNGGVCTGTHESFTCECAQGWQGSDCSTPKTACGYTPCQHGGSCVDNGDSIASADLLALATYSCACTSTGYHGVHCELDETDCDGSSCSGNGECVDGVNSFTCICDSGYYGDTCAIEGLYGFSSNTFTSCGQEGSTGPTLDMCSYNFDSSYATMVDQGIQRWVVPKTTTYSISIKGANGGGNEAGGSGYAFSVGDVPLVAEDIVFILVGQVGQEVAWNDANEEYSGVRGGAGGGGGSFVWKLWPDGSPELLAAAGGGGGQSFYHSGGFGSHTMLSSVCGDDNADSEDSESVRYVYGNEFDMAAYGQGGPGGWRQLNSMSTGGGGSGWFSNGGDGSSSQNDWAGGGGGRFPLDSEQPGYGGVYSSHRLLQAYAAGHAGDGGDRKSVV